MPGRAATGYGVHKKMTRAAEDLDTCRKQERQIAEAIKKEPEA